MASIPNGWILQPDGSYSAPESRKAEFKANSQMLELRTKAPNFSQVKTTDEGRLNKTEAAYLAHLRVLYPAVGIQDITLKLADDCRLTPDFNYINENGRFVFVDVKGFQREDALIKMKVAARKFRWADFHIVKKQSGGWDVSEVKP